MFLLRRSVRFLAVSLVVSGLLAGCGPSTPTSPAKPSGSSAPKPSASTAVQGPATSVGEIMIAFQEMEMAVMEFRTMEAANTDSSGLLRGVAYAAASSKMTKKRAAFEQMLAKTTSADVPQIDQIREAYAPVGSALKGYITVTTVNGVLSGPDARASILNYGLFLAKTPGFKKNLTRLQSEAGTKSAGMDNDLIAADKAVKAALENYYGLMNSGADAEKVKTAASEVEQAKSRLQQLGVKQDKSSSW